MKSNKANRIPLAKRTARAESLLTTLRQTAIKATCQINE
jgi:hypothetical protein